MIETAFSFIGCIAVVILIVFFGVGSAWIKYMEDTEITGRKKKKRNKKHGKE